MPNNAIPMTVMDNSTAVQLQATEGIAVDVRGKADKVTGATSGDFAGLDANGNLTDSGKKAADFLVEKGTDSALGARPLRRVVQEYVEDPLADLVLAGKAKPRLRGRLAKDGKSIRF